MNGLESLPAENRRVRVFRLAALEAAPDLLDSLGMDAAAAAGLVELLRSRGILEPLEAIWDAPFRSRRRLRVSRFSDGSFPVFYAALDEDTAAAEVLYWFAKLTGNPSKPHTRLYTRFSVTFEGTVKDLRAKRGEWPGLTRDSDYAFCNRLGAEAVAAGLDGLLAPSARRDGGTNLPAFRRAALRDPEERGTVAATWDPSTGRATLAAA